MYIQEKVNNLKWLLRTSKVKNENFEETGYVALEMIPQGQERDKRRCPWISQAAEQAALKWG